MVLAEPVDRDPPCERLRRPGTAPEGRRWVPAPRPRHAATPQPPAPVGSGHGDRARVGLRAQSAREPTRPPSPVHARVGRQAADAREATRPSPPVHAAEGRRPPTEASRDAGLHPCRATGTEPVWNCGHRPHGIPHGRHGRSTPVRDSRQPTHARPHDLRERTAQEHAAGYPRPLGPRRTAAAVAAAGAGAANPGAGAANPGAAADRRPAPAPQTSVRAPPERGTR
jgi:hypothetical protein